MAEINIPGLIAIIVFYLVIIGIGIWAARRRKNNAEETMLAGRSIGGIIGTFTMTGNDINIYKCQCSTCSSDLGMFLRWWPIHFSSGLKH